MKHHLKKITHPKPYLLIAIILLPPLIAGLMVYIYFQSYKYYQLTPHKIKLQPLTPEINEPNTSTDSKNLEEYIIIGDTGTGNKNQYQVAKAIYSYCLQKQTCKFMIDAGDIIYEKGVTEKNDIQFQTKFENPYQLINLPIYIAMGNHDYLGCSECYLQYANQSPKWYQPGFYYSINQSKLVTFYVIDTENYTVKQHEWLSEQLYKSTTKYNIVVGHRPLQSFEVTKWRENWNGKDLLKKLICNQADYYISGHAHVLEDTGQVDNCKVKQLVSGGGGAYHRKVVLPNSDAFYHEGYGYLALQVYPDKIGYKFYNQFNQLLYKKNQ